MFKRASQRLQDAARRPTLYHPGVSPNYGDKRPAPIPAEPTEPPIDPQALLGLLLLGVLGVGWVGVQAWRGVKWVGRTGRGLMRRGTSDPRPSTNPSN